MVFNGCIMFIWCPTDNKAYILSIISLSICLFVLQLYVVLSSLLRPLIVCLKTQHVFGVMDTENSDSIKLTTRAYSQLLATTRVHIESSTKQLKILKNSRAIRVHSDMHSFVFTHTRAFPVLLTHTHTYKCIITTLPSIRMDKNPHHKYYC